jgi:hypothetical protein
MEILGVLRGGVRMAVAASRGKRGRLTVGMAAGNGIMTGGAAEFRVGGMAEFIRIDIPLGSNFCLIAVACHARIVLALTVAERISRTLRPGSHGNAGKEQERRRDDNASL